MLILIHSLWEGVLAHGWWAYCFWACGRQHILLGACGRETCSPHGSQEAKAEEEEVSDSIGHIPNDLTSLH
jgi:hypothetical protein